MQGNEVYIYDWVRTPRGRGKRTGALYRVKPVQLLKVLLIALQQRTQLDTSCVDDLIIGCVTACGDQGANIARVAVLFSDWHESIPGFTLNRFCASGLEACNIAAAKIASGMAQAMVAGGVESMSRIPIAADGGAWYIDPEVNRKLSFVPQGISADIIATRAGFSRAQLDVFAAASHHKAHAAHRAGFWQRSLVAVHDDNGKLLLDHDEVVRPDCDAAEIGKLKPSFIGIGKIGFDAVAMARYPQLEKIEHVHHPGNSSAIVDGAALMLLGDKKFGQKFGLRARARVVSNASVGSEPTIMLTGNPAATRKALATAQLQLKDIDLFEVNEAFAAVALHYLQETKVNPEQLNVNGGAIAMGHPLGATGTMVLGTLLDELERRDLRRGLATFCAGAGMATTTVIERV